MRVVTFRANGSTLRPGLLTDNHAVIDLLSAAEDRDRSDAETVASVRSLLDAGERGFDLAESLAEWALRHGRREPVPLSDVALAAPIPDPSHLVCIAGNYGDHIREGGGQVESGKASRPRMFLKPRSTIIPSGQPIRLPDLAPDTIDYEGELGVVIGRDCSRVREDDAMTFVAGYVILNDVSARGMEDNSHHSRADGWGKFFGWLDGKSFDTFAPMGPFLALREIHDPMALAIETTVNGERRQHGKTAEMILDVPSIVAGISRVFTLRPGDVIGTGTPAGVADATGRYLRPGDTVEVRITGLGTLSNPVSG